MDFPKVLKPANKIKVDFGPYGIKWTCAQITKHYTKEILVGKQSIAVRSLLIKQIADFKSEFLLTGFADGNGDIVLASIDHRVPNGSKLI